MSKRKFSDTDNDENKEPEDNKKPKIVRIKLKLENSPPANNIKDLINIGETLKFYKNIDVIVLWEILPYLKELDAMIGMTSLKETIFYQIIYYLQNMHSKNKNGEYLHTIITGNPGCGKTSVAKIIGNIYANLKILSRQKNIFKIGYRDDFVAEYLGQTAIKTRKFLQSCLGGVLFIDEVYSLGSGQKDRDSFSKEAIDTICSFLSDHKNDFCCIIAGYKNDIQKCFLSANSGLERRFPWRHDIEEYTNENLSDILLKMIKEINWILHDQVDTKFLIMLIKENKELFKNTGGSIETFISKLKMAHSKRVFGLDKKEKFILTKEDFNSTVVIVKKHINDEKEQKPRYDYYT